MSEFNKPVCLLHRNIVFNILSINLCSGFVILNHCWKKYMWKNILEDYVQSPKDGALWAAWRDAAEIQKKKNSSNSSRRRRSASITSVRCGWVDVGKVTLMVVLPVGHLSSWSTRYGQKGQSSGELWDTYCLKVANCWYTVTFWSRARLNTNNVSAEASRG